MKNFSNLLLVILVVSLTTYLFSCHSEKDSVGVGIEAPKGAEIIFDGTRKMLDEKWTYWEGPRFSSELPIKWFLVDDPVDCIPRLRPGDQGPDSEAL